MSYRISWRILIKPYCCFLVVIVLCACSNKNTEVDNSLKNDIALIETPTFNADSAFYFVEKQLQFGPRVPNTKAHQACAEFLKNKLTNYGAQVMNQNLELEAYDGTMLKGQNIVASFNIQAKKRVLLAAHWDTRHVADKDPAFKSNDSSEVILQGANDGASGVAVLLELARLIAKDDTTFKNLGIDIILFDLEDYGSPETGEGYCLGSQYWSKNKHKENYAAYYGILLDMVGGKNSKFVYEEISFKYGKTILKKVWTLADRMGYGSLFVKKRVPHKILDDHYFLNVEAKIPTIDIIGYNPINDNFFHESWHTQQDDISVIDKILLKKVGQLLLQVLYQESA